MAKFYDIAASSMTGVLVSILVATNVRDPLPPPRFYYEPRMSQVAEYDGKNVRITARLLTHFYDPSKPGDIEIILQMEDGSPPMKAVGGRVGSLYEVITQGRDFNVASPENLGKLHLALQEKERMIGRTDGTTPKVTIIGRLEGSVLKAYGAIIDGKHYPIVNYNPDKLRIL